MSSLNNLNNHSSLASTAVLVAVATGTAVLTSGVWWVWLQQRRHRFDADVDTALRQAQDLRQEERTGRIRAEVKLRQVSKQLQQLQANAAYSNASEAVAAATNGNDKSKNSSDKSISTTMILRSIGTVTSPYTKRMGTPRQPQLVPSSRGFIEFTCPAAALDGMDAYSHVWIIFEFHANTSVNNSNKTKIRPPRAGGARVGQLATRSPHRPNCLGLSLVQVAAWDSKQRRLHVRGLDLVHGTPVYDVKPCVPWDVPATPLRVPTWVDSDDALATVTFSDQASADLPARLSEGCLAPLYNNSNNNNNADMEDARNMLQEILAQDPRSSHKGLKRNARGTASTDNNKNNNKPDEDAAYNLILGKCQVFFRVQPPDTVWVERIDKIDLESAMHVDGVPLIMASSGGENKSV